MQSDSREYTYFWVAVSPAFSTLRLLAQTYRLNSKGNCRVFYSWQFGCKTFIFRSVEALQVFLQVTIWVGRLRLSICRNFVGHIQMAIRVRSLCSSVCRNFAKYFIGGNLEEKPSLLGLQKHCRIFYRWQFGWEVFGLPSVEILQGILQVTIWI